MYLARSSPTVLTMVHGRLLKWALTPPLWHAEAVGGVHTIRPGQSTVRWLKERRIDTVLVGLQYSPRVIQDAHHAAIPRALQEVASAENVLLVHRFRAMQFIAMGSKHPPPCGRTSFHPRHWPRKTQSGVSLTKAV